MSGRKEIAGAFHKGQADCITALTAENERLQGVLTANAEMLTYRETEVSVAATRIAKLRAALIATQRRVTMTGDPDVDCDFDERAAILAVQEIAAAVLKEEP